MESGLGWCSAWPQSRLKIMRAKLVVQVEKTVGIHNVSKRETLSDLGMNWIWKNRRER